MKKKNIIDIGGGHDPIEKANVVTDLYLDGDNTSRGNPNLKLFPHQKFVQCNMENMPFKDNEFDYSYCRHVLEHVDNPIQACKEIMRISKEGYIETPTELWEKLFGRKYHKWVLRLEEDILIFKKNPGKTNTFNGDKLFSECQMFKEMFVENIDLFSVRLHWKKKFNFLVFNGEKNEK